MVRLLARGRDGPGLEMDERVVNSNAGGGAGGGIIGVRRRSRKVRLAVGNILMTLLCKIGFDYVAFINRIRKIEKV